MLTVAPEPPQGPSVWTGRELADDTTWRVHWPVDAINAAVNYVHGRDLDKLATTPVAELRGTCPPELVELAAGLTSEIIGGRGFVLLSGLPVHDLDERTTAGVFLLLGGLIGLPRSQNADGHLLGHVRDVGKSLDDPTSRIYQTNRRQTFHTDSTDVVGLLCLQTAASGGQSLLASAGAVYREFHRRRPDLAPVLFDVVATDRRGEQPPGMLPWFEIPVLSWFDNHLTVLYQRQYIDSAARFPDAPALRAEQVEALDLFDDIVNEPDMHLSMDLEVGDIQFVHNHSLLHDRTGFVDHDDPSQRRHLLRLWLSAPDDRSLPPVFSQRYGSVTVGERGGIVVAGTELTVPLHL